MFYYQFSAMYAATNARLNHEAGNGLTGAWGARTLDIGEWIQVDLGEITKVTKIATQGSQNDLRWVTEFKVSYSLNGGHFEFHREASNITTDQVRERVY